MSTDKKPTKSWAAMMEEEEEILKNQQPQKQLEALGRKQQETRAQQIARDHRAIEDAEKRRLMMEDERRLRERERLHKIGIATPERPRREIKEIPTSPWKIPTPPPSKEKELEDKLKQLQHTVQDLQDKLRQDVSFVLRRLEDEEKLRDEKLNAFSKKEDLDRRILQDKISKQQEEISHLTSLVQQLQEDKIETAKQHEKETIELKQELAREFKEQLVALKEEFQNDINKQRKEMEEEFSKQSPWKVVKRTGKPEEEKKFEEKPFEHEFRRKERSSRQWRRTSDSPKTSETPPKTQ